MQAVVQDSPRIPGLCSVCKNVKTCTKRYRDGIVMWYCEECGGIADVAAAHSPQAAVHADESDLPDRLMGLCVNCERRDYCAHAKRVGGVWHCEEYL